MFQRLTLHWVADPNPVLTRPSGRVLLNTFRSNSWQHHSLTCSSSMRFTVNVGGLQMMKDDDLTANEWLCVMYEV